MPTFATINPANLWPKGQVGGYCFILILPTLNTAQPLFLLHPYKFCGIVTTTLGFLED